MKRQKKKSFFNFILLFIVLFAIGGFFLVRQDNDFFNFGGKELEVISTSQYNNKNNVTFESLEDYIIRCSRDGISMLTQDERLIWDKTLNLKNPKMISEGNYIAVGDINGQELYLFNKEGFINRYPFSYPIINFDVNENGHISVLQELNKKHILEIYDQKGTLIAERVTYFENDGYPIGFDLSNDGISLVTSYLYLKDNTIKSNITFFDFSSTGKVYEEQIRGAFVIEESIMADIKFLDNDHLLAIGDNKLIFYKISPKPEKIKEIDIQYEIKNIAYSDSKAFIIYEGDVSSNSKDLLHIYDLNGDMIYDTEFTNVVKYLNADEESFYVGSDTFLKKYNTNGNIKWEYTLKKDIKDVYPLFNNKYLMVYRNEYEVIKIK